MVNSKKFSITTKSGDKGKTSLLDGSRVNKSSLRPETYGTIDEANAFLGALRAATTVAKTKELVIRVQNHIFFINSELACPPDKRTLLKRIINEKDISYLDEQIASLEAKLQLPREFVLYGGTLSSAFADIARAVVRRAERFVVRLDNEEILSNGNIKKYLNRLSDFLFLLARYEEFSSGVEPLHPENK